NVFVLTRTCLPAHTSRAFLLSKLLGLLANSFGLVLASSLSRPTRQGGTFVTPNCRPGFHFHLYHDRLDDSGRNHFFAHVFQRPAVARACCLNLGRGPGTVSACGNV